MAQAFGIVWAAVVVLAASGAWEAWGAFVRDTIRNPPALPNLPGLAGAFQRHSVTAGVLLVLAACSFLAGRRVAAFLRTRSLAAVERFGLAVAVGWGSIAFVLLGLALIGLFFPSLVLAAILLAGVAGVGCGRAPAWPKPSRTTVLLFLLAGAPGLLVLVANLLPDNFYDTYANHLAAPDHSLKLHRLVTAGQHYTINYQLPAELLNALAILFGRDEITHGVSLIPFLAGLAVTAAWAARVCGPRAAAVGAGLSLGLGGLGWVLLRGKNDPAVAGFCLMALVFVVDRRWILSAVCWGLAVATKLNAYMLIMPAAVLTGWAVRRLPRGRRLAVAGWMAALAAVPAIPWMLREFLDRGTPFWPILNSRWHGFPWESDAVVALAQYHTGPAHLGRSLATFLPTWLADNPILLWAVPLSWVGLRRAPAAVREMAGWTVCLFLFLFGVIHMEYGRYSLPVLVLLCFVCAPVVLDLVGREGGRMRWAYRAAVLALVWSPFALVLRDAGLTARNVTGYVAGRTTYAARLDQLMTTRLAAQRALRSLGGVRSVVLVDEVYAFKWPGRVVTETMPGRAVPWALTKEANDPGRIRIRLRQFGASHLVLNYVSEGHPYNANVYAWDDRQLGVWREFMRGYAERVAAALPCDVPNGGFCIWRIAARPGPARGPLFYLPGIKPLRAWLRQPYHDAGDSRATAERALAMVRRYPDVLVFKAEAGLFLAGAGEWVRAHAFLRECADAGMVGEALYTYLGTAAMHLGRLDEALRDLGIAERVYPGERDDIERRTGEVLARKARVELRARRPEAALAVALEAARRAPGSAFALVTLADVRMVRGEFAEALSGYLRVASLGGVPGPILSHADEMVRQCRARLTRPTPGPGTTPRSP